MSIVGTGERVSASASPPTFRVNVAVGVELQATHATKARTAGRMRID